MEMNASSNDYKVWTEKYRPKELDHIIGNPLVTNKLKQVVSRRNITHLILDGPAGVGKTTAAYAIAREIFGDDNLVGQFKEINASEKRWRGIDVVSSTIEPFAKNLPLVRSAPYKILLLEEADNLTKDMQKALRRPMEKYANNCRFILTVNDYENILEPVQSRCQRYTFTEVNSETLIQHLKYIASMEGLTLTEKQFVSIAKNTKGDVRRGVELLQNMQIDTSDYEGVFGR